MSVFRSFIQHLGDNSRIYSIGELDKLISSDEHPAYMRKHRAELLLERIRFIASLLSILIPL
ncbi:MAG: hypothetical protein KME58_15895 [Candidatus Thiodiazotropha sp. (ex Lucina pensylvanica)]|nr:hypothetical protein [Candidatus Thiodiazotropha sp. (ex Lucina pensylvanica)]